MHSYPQTWRKGGEGTQPSSKAHTWKGQHTLNSELWKGNLVLLVFNILKKRYIWVSTLIHLAHKKPFLTIDIQSAQYIPPRQLRLRLLLSIPDMTLGRFRLSPDKVCNDVLLVKKPCWFNRIINSGQWVTVKGQAGSQIKDKLLARENVVALVCKGNCPSVNPVMQVCNVLLSVARTGIACFSSLCSWGMVVPYFH